MSNIAIETLVEKRTKLLAEKAKMTEHFDEQINALTKTIQMMGGEPIDFGLPLDIATYDDENPDYIRNNEDGL